MKNCAIFIDLENFHRSLRKYDENLAKAVVINPHTWLQSLRSYDTDHGGQLSVRRNFVIAKSYFGDGFVNEFKRNTSSTFNPAAFTYAGIVNEYCPQLTGDGKNAADIRMAVECISHVSRYGRLDEVFILADDADYLPLVQELRRIGCQVYITRCAITTSSREYGRLAELIGVKFLTGRDFEHLLPQFKPDNLEFRVGKADVKRMKTVLCQAANLTAS